MALGAVGEKRAVGTADRKKKRIMIIGISRKRIYGTNGSMVVFLPPVMAVRSDTQAIT